MNWVEVEIEDNSVIACSKCKVVIAQLADVDIYGAMNDYLEGPKSFIFLKSSLAVNDRFLLDKATITNEKTLFLMYLQTLRCSACLQEIGVFFKTANVDNKFALKRYALNTRLIRIGDHQQITLAMFEQALRSSMESLTKKQLIKQSQVSIFSKYSILKTYTTIKGSYAKLEKIMNTQILKALREQISKQKKQKQQKIGQYW